MGSLLLKVLTLTLTFGMALRSNALPQNTQNTRRSATSLSSSEQTVNVAEDDQQSQTTAESCHEWQQTGAKSGVHLIRLPGESEIHRVWCDMDSSDGGWLVFQRRRDGSVDFYRNWTEYENGFGDVTGEFWLGLSRLHKLTNGRRTRLRVDLGEENGHHHYVEYSSFNVGGPETNYRLTLSRYSGDARDGMEMNNKQSFSTYDRDNDKWYNNCAATFNGGWWYRDCVGSNLNGRYQATRADGADGITWYNAHWDYRGYTFSEMKVKAA